MFNKSYSLSLSLSHVKIYCVKFVKKQVTQNILCLLLVKMKKVQDPELSSKESSEDLYVEYDETNYLHVFDEQRHLITRTHLMVCII